MLRLRKPKVVKMSNILSAKSLQTWLLSGVAKQKYFAGLTANFAQVTILLFSPLAAQIVGGLNCERWPQ
jgi:hypothetical protein